LIGAESIPMAADTLPESVERELQKLVMRYRIKGDSLIDLARDCARLGLRDAPDKGRLRDLLQRIVLDFGELEPTGTEPRSIQDARAELEG